MDEDVIEGQALVAVEIEKQLGRVSDHSMLPVGRRADLSSGILQLFSKITCRYSFVEPKEAP